MIYVTGDTHGNTDCRKLFFFAKRHPELTKSDYVIIAGDFGGVWRMSTLEEDLDAFGKLPFSILFVDGNHENFDVLESFPVEIWNGGKVHKIRPDIIHLMRGQVYEIAGKTIFTFGGATSIDKAYRIPGVSWWSRELPSYEELDEGIENLKRRDNKVDYIITHSCGLRALAYPRLKAAAGIKTACPESHLLSNFEDLATFKHWYFGHFHIDARLSDKYTVLMYDIVKLGDSEDEKFIEICKTLKNIYGDAMPEEMLGDFARELYDSLFVGRYELFDIFAIIDTYQREAGIEQGEDYYVFTDMIDLLDNCETTAQRLYDSFMHEADFLDTFLKLYNENAEYISAEKLAEAKKKALTVFDKETLEMYDITEDD